MSAIQPDTFFNVSLNTKIRQLAIIFMKRMVGGILNESHFKILRKCEGKFDCLVFEMLYIKKFKPNLYVQTDSIRAKLVVYFLLLFVFSTYRTYFYTFLT